MMSEIFTVLTDLEIIFFDLLIYTLLFALKHDDFRHRFMMYGGCAVIITAYFFTAYVAALPVSIAVASCMAVPSFLLFFVLAKYRDSRFVLTFCLVDTVSLVVAFIGRYLSLLGDLGSVSAFFIILVLFCAILLAGRKYFLGFQRLLETEKAGWGYMAAATVLIYFAMIFFAAYPKPLLERLEYFPSWMVFAAVVVCCYAVFIQSIAKTRKIVSQNERLREEKRIYQLAYRDALTGLFNRAAYIERLNVLERKRPLEGLCCIMLDCNRFKQINDQFGHAAGDRGLQGVANALQKVFSAETDQVFRVGGDEFAVLLLEKTEDAVRAALDTLRGEVRLEGEKAGLPLSLAVGYAFAREHESIESAFVRADRLMYEDKKQIAP